MPQGTARGLRPQRAGRLNVREHIGILRRILGLRRHDAALASRLARSGRSRTHRPFRAAHRAGKAGTCPGTCPPFEDWTFCPRLAERDNDGPWQNKSSGVAERRLNGQTARQFSRRSATRDDVTPLRGLKSTATFKASLREAKPGHFPAVQRPVGGPRRPEQGVEKRWWRRADNRATILSCVNTNHNQRQEKI